MTKTMVITAEERKDGWVLIDENNDDVQEGFEYDTEAEAYEACEELWPHDSMWNGRKGYIIDL